MKTLKFFAAALAIVAVASCVEVEDNPTGDNNRDESPVELVDVSFFATIDSPSDPTAPESKTTLAGDGLSVHWSAGDQINVFPFTNLDHYSGKSPYNGKSFTIENQESISDGFAKFVGQMPSGSTKYRAIYPYAAINTNDCWGDIYPFNNNTLATQNAVANNFSTATAGDNTYNSNIAIALDTPDGGTFKFKNMLAHFKFRVMVSGIKTIEFSADKVAGADGVLSESFNLGGTLKYIPAQEGDGKFNITSDTPITITNSGADFEVGTTYYVAIPALPMSGLTVVGKNSAGDGMFQFQRTSQFDPASNTIYNLGSFNATVADNLTTSTRAIVIPPAGGSVTFTITTNKDWTIEQTGGEWLTEVSSTSGGPGTHTITVSAAENGTGKNRVVAYLTVTAGTKTANISVNQAKLNIVYSRGDLVQNADELSDGASYVILRQGSTNDYLGTDNSGKLQVVGISSTTDIPPQNIFVYRKDDSKEEKSGTSYVHYAAGVLQSPYNNNAYMNPDMTFMSASLDGAQYMTFGSHWGENDPNIDIYFSEYTANGTFKGYVFLAYVNYKLSWQMASDVGDNSLRKWYFYKVNSTISE